MIRDNTPTGFLDFPPLDEFLSTRPQLLSEIPRQARIDQQMEIISRQHERIATAIRAFWGSRDCAEFIHTLIVNGSYSDRTSRMGFKKEVISALLALIELNEVEVRKRNSL